MSFREVLEENSNPSYYYAMYDLGTDKFVDAKLSNESGFAELTFLDEPQVVIKPKSSDARVIRVARAVRILQKLTKEEMNSKVFVPIGGFHDTKGAVGLKWTETFTI